MTLAPLTMSHLKATLPAVDAAMAKLDIDLKKAETTAEVDAAFEAANVVLRTAVEAIYLDTADRNSRSTIHSVYNKPSSGCGTLFGPHPDRILRALLAKFMGEEPAHV